MDRMLRTRETLSRAPRHPALVARMSKRKTQNPKAR
jgi:hypothetical protein